MKRFARYFLGIMTALLLLLPAQVLADAAIEGDYNHQPADYYVVVNSDDGFLNYRYGAGLEYPILYPIYNGELVHIIETADNFNDGLQWGQTDFGEEYGWICLEETELVDNPYAQPETEWNPTTPAAYEESDSGQQKVLTRVNYYGENGELTEWMEYGYQQGFDLPVSIDSYDSQGVLTQHRYVYDEQNRLTAVILCGLPEEIIGLYPVDYLWNGQTAVQASGYDGVAIYEYGCEYQGDRLIRELQLTPDLGANQIKEYTYDEAGDVVSTTGDIFHSDELYLHMVNMDGNYVTRIYYDNSNYWIEQIYDQKGGNLIREEYYTAADFGGELTDARNYYYFTNPYFAEYVTAPDNSDAFVRHLEKRDSAGRKIFDLLISDEAEMTYDDAGYLTEAYLPWSRIELIYE